MAMLRPSPPALRVSEPLPAWLPARVRALVAPETARLQVELYGTPGAWLLRILQLPEDGDAPTWAERWFALDDPVSQAKPLPAEAIQADPGEARYRGARIPLQGRWVLPAR